MLTAVKKFFTSGEYRKLEYVYVAIALFFGFIFICIIPPGWNPDETQHYWRAQQVAHGDLMPKEFDGENGLKYTGGTLPEDEAWFIGSYKVGEALDDHSIRLNFPMWNNEGVIRGGSSDSPDVTIPFSGSARYSPFVYLPQSIALAISGVLGLPLLLGFFLAKFAGLLFQIAATAYSIKITPKGKWIFFILGLLPITVVQSSAISADIVTTSISFLFIATVLNLALSKKTVTNKHILLLSGFVAALGLVKPAYLPLAAILLLIPINHKSFRNWKNLLKIAIPTAIAALPGIIWLLATSFIQDNYSHGVSPDAQKQFIADNPLGFLGALLNTYLTDAQPKLYRTLLGNFIWDSAPMPFIFMIITAITIAVSTLLTSAREIKQKLSALTKTTMLATSALLIVAISIGLYIYYTPPGDTSILGLQSRYFIPFMPLILMPFMIAIPYRNQKVLKKITICLLLACLFVAIIVLMNRIYR